MKRRILFCWVLILSAVQAFSQNFSISGFITDDETGEPLIGAVVFEPNLRLGATTNINGFYTLVLPSGDRKIEIRYVGYYVRLDSFYLGSNRSYSAALLPDSYLEEVVVNANDYSDESSTPNAVNIPMHQIRAIPPVFGEVDLIKAIQMLPGVQSGTEGGSGLYVRGGTPDQNLILLDGVPVYNINHVFGFFSAFNVDAISQFQLYKGGFPARYGSRLSSVLEITLKDGNSKEFSGAAGISLLSFYGYLEGPIYEDKTSFSFSFRRTMPGILNLFNPLLTGTDNEVSGAYFYDLTAKVTHRFSEKDKLSLSFYRGKDKFYSRLNEQYFNGPTRVEDKYDNQLDWGNTTASLRWSHLVNSRLFSNHSVSFTEYKFNIREGFERIAQTDTSSSNSNYQLRYFSGIRDFAVKSDFEYIPSYKHYFRYGAIYTLHAFAPGAIEANFQTPSISLDTILGPSRRTLGSELAIYGEDDIKVNARLRANVGLRISTYLVNGKAYMAPEPRFSMRYSLSSKLAFKASYTWMNQYLHLLTNSGLGLPTDLWVPATEKIKPQSAHQVTAALVRTVKDNWEFSVEGYYKTMKNVLDYAEGAGFINTQSDWESRVEQGIGKNYGVEFLAQKKYGIVTGWLGYTLAWNLRKFDEINNGNWYYFRYDRRHQVNLSGSVKVSDRNAFSFNVVYGSGYPVTFPYGRYLDANGNEVFDYEVKNGYRMRYYLRFDVGYTNTRESYTSDVKQELMISIYNLLNRNNPYYLYLSYDATGKPVAKEVSLIPFFPSISYRISF